jgi:hypothetical protein
MSQQHITNYFVVGNITINNNNASPVKQTTDVATQTSVTDQIKEKKNCESKS